MSGNIEFMVDLCRQCDKDIMSDEPYYDIGGKILCSECHAKLKKGEVNKLAESR